MYTIDRGGRKQRIVEPLRYHVIVERRDRKFKVHRDKVCSAFQVDFRSDWAGVVTAVPSRLSSCVRLIRQQLVVAAPVAAQNAAINCANPSTPCKGTPEASSFSNKRPDAATGKARLLTLNSVIDLPSERLGVKKDSHITVTTD